MHKLASLNHQIKSNSEIYLPAISTAAFYGKSIFTTAAVYHAEIFQWEKHWRRLQQNAIQIGIDLNDFPEEKIEETIEHLIAANNLQNGRIRITFFDESIGGIWATETKEKTKLLVTTADFQTRQDEFRLTISPFPVNSKSPLINIKSGNYLEKILALEECRRRKFNEAVCFNEKNETVSAVMANLFWVKNQTIFTPPLETGALGGTTRKFMMENFPVTEKIIEYYELKQADEMFITSAGIGVNEVKYFETQVLSDFRISTKVQKFFNEFTENKFPKNRF